MICTIVHNFLYNCAIGKYVYSLFSLFYNFSSFYLFPSSPSMSLAFHQMLLASKFHVLGATVQIYPYWYSFRYWLCTLNLSMHSVVLLRVSLYVWVYMCVQHITIRKRNLTSLYPSKHHHNIWNEFMIFIFVLLRVRVIVRIQFFFRCFVFFVFSFPVLSKYINVLIVWSSDEEREGRGGGLGRTEMESIEIRLPNFPKHN